jgi:hypothetical protein
MNGSTRIRMRTILGTNEANLEIGDRHIVVNDIPGELKWQSHHCGLSGDLKIIKLTIAPEVEQRPETADAEEPEVYPVYGVPDLSRFYDEL